MASYQWILRDYESLLWLNIVCLHTLALHASFTLILSPPDIASDKERKQAYLRKMYESPEMAEKQWTSKKGVDGLLHCVCPKQCNICWGEGWWIVDTFFTNLKTWHTPWICDDAEILTSSSLASILSACHKQWYLFMNCTKFPFPYLKSKEWHIDFTYCYFMTDIYPNNMFNIIQSFKG